MSDFAKKGQIVKSKAGRDAGRHFVIFEVLDEDYVQIVDGDLRKVEKPKKKKRRHLAMTRANALDTPGFAFTNKKLKGLLQPLNDGGTGIHV